VLGLAAVYNSKHIPFDCLEKVRTGLRLLPQLGSREPVRSTSAAIEQMIARICALQGRTQVDDGQTAMSQNPSIATEDSLRRTDLSADLPTDNPVVCPAQDAFANITWDDDGLLDDLWSVMDWNVGFPSLDLTSSTPDL
jgi:hypothetical protein